LFHIATNALIVLGSLFWRRGDPIVFWENVNDLAYLIVFCANNYCSPYITLGFNLLA